MVFKKSFCLFLLLIVFSLFAITVFAQNTNEQFVQIIEWDSVDYAMHYNVVIEKKSALGTWELHETFEVTTNVLELTLGAGDYRYNVTVYNVFGRAEQTTDWYNFTIEKALQPVVTDIFPKELDLKTGESVDEETIISLNPKDVSEDATFFLQRTEGNTTLYGDFIGYDENGMMQIEFETEQLSSGNYELIIQDPSGLTSENVSTTSFITVEHYSPYYFNISAGYSYAVFPPYENGIFGGFTFPVKNISARAKVSYFPFVSPTIGALGFELSSYLLYSNFIARDTNLQGFIFPITFNVAYQKQFGKKFVFDTHLGVGSTFLYNFMEHTRNIPMQNAASLSASVGIAGQYFIGDNFFVELGADYIYSYLLDNSSFHVVLPTLSVGWNFGKNTSEPLNDEDVSTELDFEQESSDNTNYLNMSLGYTYALFPPIENTLYESYDFPTKNISGKAKISYFPFVSPTVGSFGFEFSTFILYNTFANSNVELSGFMFPVTVNGVYQKQIGKKFVLDAHLGAGATFLYNFMEQNTSTSIQNVAGIALNAGVAGQYYITDSIFVELGADYVFTYFVDGASFHSILPTLSVGLNFD